MITCIIFAAVIFSVPGGFYEEVFQLKLYNFFQQNHIRYTTNGNRPTAQSPLYEGTMTLDYSKYSTSHIYTIQISPDDLVYVPDSVQHCIVIRAAVFDNNDSCVSKVVTNSYFIKELGCDTHGLPAVSICADSLKIYAREEYGKKRFKHRFFENSMRDSIKHLVIKPYSSLYPFFRYTRLHL